MNPLAGVPLACPLRIAGDERAAIEAAVSAVLDRGPLVLGPWVEAFEEDLGRYLAPAAPPQVVGVASGSDALVLALTVLDLPPGSDVLVPANDGGFAAWAVLAAGLRPRATDVDPHTMLVTVETAEQARTPATTALVVTHLHGSIADMDALDRWRRSHDLRLVEDCAQATGAHREGRHAGGWADLAAHSFYPTKNLGALGDGGAVSTSDATFADRLRSLRTYGWGERFRVEHPGGRNSRLDALQAGVLSARLPFLDRSNQRRRAVAGAYAGAVQMRPLEKGSVVHHAVVLVDDRKSLQRYLERAGVATAVHYPWLVTEMAGLDVADPAALPAADASRAAKLTLPCFPTMTPAEVDRVCAALSSWKVGTDA